MQSFCSIFGASDGGALASGLSVDGVGLPLDVDISPLGSATAVPSIFWPHAAVSALTSTNAATIHCRRTGVKVPGGGHV
ncbi:hypothetical protein GCM10029964_107610 [Kibdelosporangium lantanae]